MASVCDLPDNRLAQPLDDLLDQVAGDWRPVVEAWRGTQVAQSLVRLIDARRASGVTVYPAAPFRALHLTPLQAVQVVILGQDPYHAPGQAEGLAFSVPPGVSLPPSLRNIFTELQRDLGLPAPVAGQGHLGAWARQGVLLLNATLTVEDGAAASHAKRGWESLTDALIEAVAGLPRAVTFMLWGAHAQAKAPLIESVAPGRHRILSASHPSPLSARRPPRPFIGCGHFGQVAAAGIDWRLGRSGAGGR